MEIGSCSYAHLGRTVAMFFVMTLVCSVPPARGLLLCILWSNAMWKNQTLSGAKLRSKD